MVVDVSFSGTTVVRELEDLIRTRGLLKRIVSHNRAEFTSVAVLKWSEKDISQLALH